MDSNETGYKPSNYHETLFMRTRFARLRFTEAIETLPDKWRRLSLIIADHFLVESYLCFFHILDSSCSFEWLERNWNDNAHFIFYEPRCEYADSVIGNRYCGQKMRYVKSAEEINVRETVAENPGITTVLLDQETFSAMPMDYKAQYYIEAEEAIAPLFNRIIDSEHDASENEYRILARSPRRYVDGHLHIDKRNEMQVQVGDSMYDVRLRQEQTGSGKSGFNIELVFRSCSDGAIYEMYELVQTGLTPRIVPQFLELDITDTAVRYGYIGTKSACREFMRAELSGENDGRQEDDYYHLHHGEWCKYLDIKPLDPDDHWGDLVIRPPEDGYFH